MRKRRFPDPIDCMDSSEAIYRRTETSLWLFFTTLFMVGLSCLLAAGGAWLQIAFVLPWAVLIPCFWNPLTVWVTGENLEARLGFGILKKTIPLAEIKSIKLIDVSLSKRKRHIWLCFNRRALEIISLDDKVLWLGSSEPETLATFLEK